MKGLYHRRGSSLCPGGGGQPAEVPHVVLLAEGGESKLGPFQDLPQHLQGLLRPARTNTGRQPNVHTTPSVTQLRVNQIQPRSNRIWSAGSYTAHRRLKRSLSLPTKAAMDSFAVPRARSRRLLAHSNEPEQSASVLLRSSSPFQRPPSLASMSRVSSLTAEALLPPSPRVQHLRNLHSRLYSGVSDSSSDSSDLEASPSPFSPPLLRRPPRVVRVSRLARSGEGHPLQAGSLSSCTPLTASQISISSEEAGLAGDAPPAAPLRIRLMSLGEVAAALDCTHSDDGSSDSDEEAVTSSLPRASLLVNGAPLHESVSPLGQESSPTEHQSMRRREKFVMSRRRRQELHLEAGRARQASSCFNRRDSFQIASTDVRAGPASHQLDSGGDKPSGEWGVATSEQGREVLLRSKSARGAGLGIHLSSWEEDGGMDAASLQRSSGPLHLLSSWSAKAFVPTTKGCGTNNAGEAEEGGAHVPDSAGQCTQEMPLQRQRRRQHQWQEIQARLEGASEGPGVPSGTGQDSSSPSSPAGGDEALRQDSACPTSPADAPSAAHGSSKDGRLSAGAPVVPIVPSKAVSLLDRLESEEFRISALVGSGSKSSSSRKVLGARSDLLASSNKLRAAAGKAYSDASSNKKRGHLVSLISKSGPMASPLGRSTRSSPGDEAQTSPRMSSLLKGYKRLSGHGSCDTPLMLVYPPAGLSLQKNGAPRKSPLGHTPRDALVTARADRAHHGALANAIVSGSTFNHHLTWGSLDWEDEMEKARMESAAQCVQGAWEEDAAGEGLTVGKGGASWGLVSVQDEGSLWELEGTKAVGAGFPALGESSKEGGHSMKRSFFKGRGSRKDGDCCALDSKGSLPGLYMVVPSDSSSTSSMSSCTMSLVSPCKPSPRGADAVCVARVTYPWKGDV